MDVVINEREIVKFTMMNLFSKVIFPPRKAEGSSRHFTHSIDLVENLPLLVRDPQGLGRLDRPFQLAGPHLQINNFLLLDELLQRLRELEEEPGEVRREQGPLPPLKASFQGLWLSRQDPAAGLPLAEPGAGPGHTTRTNAATRLLPNTYLLPARRQTRIPTNLANKIIFTLTMSAKVDGTRLDMNVH